MKISSWIKKPQRQSFGEKPDDSFPPHYFLRCGMIAVWPVAMSLMLFLSVTTGIASAELPQRNRSLPYEPVRRQAAVQQPVVLQSVDSQRYIVNRPTPDPQESSTASSLDRNRDYGSDGEEMLPLPKLVDSPLNPGARAALDNLSVSIRAKQSGTVTPPGDNTPGNPTPGNVGGTPSTPGTNIGPIFVERIFQDELEKQWYARKEGELTPIPLFKLDGRFYRKDANGNPQNEVLVNPADSTDGDQTKDNTKSAITDDQTRNAVLLIVTTVAALAALGVGFLAFDYKHRWEQEVVTQNSRLLGGTALHGTTTHGAYGEPDSLEPETLSFSAHDYRSLDDSFDHSFRTIA